MPFYIVNANGIYPLEYSSYERAGANCEADEFVYFSDSLVTLEEILDAQACQG